MAGWQRGGPDLGGRLEAIERSTPALLPLLGATAHSIIRACWRDLPITSALTRARRSAREPFWPVTPVARRSRWKVPAALVGIATLAMAGAWAGRLLGSVAPTPVSMTGTIEATQVDVSVKITGRIVERLVKEGQAV